MPHIWGKDHPLQPTKEKCNKENLQVNIILVKWHQMSPLWRLIQKYLGRVVPKPSTGTAPHLSTPPSAVWLGVTATDNPRGDEKWGRSNYCQPFFSASYSQDDRFVRVSDLQGEVHMWLWAPAIGETKWGWARSHGCSTGIWDTGDMA